MFKIKLCHNKKKSRIKVFTIITSEQLLDADSALFASAFSKEKTSRVG